MKTKIYLLLLLIFGFFQTSNTSAYLQGCDLAEKDIVKYAPYQKKIDAFFTTVSKQERDTQKKIYKKLQWRLSDYLGALDKNKQEKAYTIFLYMHCRVQERYSHISYEDNNREVDLALVLENIKKKAKTYKFTTIKTVRWKTFFEGPMYVVWSEIHNISVEQIEELLLWEVNIKELLDNKTKYGLYSVFIKWNFLFLGIWDKAELHEWKFRSFIVISSFWEAKIFKGIYELWENVVLWDNKGNSKSHILDTKNEDTFTYEDTIENMKWLSKKWASSSMIYFKWWKNGYWIIWDNQVYDFWNLKKITLPSNHQLVFAWEGINVLYFNHKYYYFTITVTDKSDDNQCSIKEVSFSKDNKHFLYWDEVEWYCNWYPDPMFSYIQSDYGWVIYDYYELIEKQDLASAFWKKYDEVDDYKDAFSEFKKLYTFDEYVEINVTSMTSLWWSKLKYVVELHYEGWKYEKYEIISEVISWMVDQIKTLSVKQIK